MINSIKGVKKFIKWIIIGGVILVPILYFLLRETVDEILTENRWCVEKVIFQGEEIGPNTVYETPHVSMGNCINEARFNQSGELLLPGLDSEPIRGTWKSEKGKVLLSTTEFSNVFSGDYSWEWNKREMKLEAVYTSIILRTNNFTIPNVIH